MTRKRPGWLWICVVAVLFGQLWPRDYFVFDVQQKEKIVKLKLKEEAVPELGIRMKVHAEKYVRHAYDSPFPVFLSLEYGRFVEDVPDDFPWLKYSPGVLEKTLFVGLRGDRGDTRDWDVLPYALRSIRPDRGPTLWDQRLLAEDATERMTWMVSPAVRGELVGLGEVTGFVVLRNKEDTQGGTHPFRIRLLEGTSLYVRTATRLFALVLLLVGLW